jgi:hypothetical protein
MNFIQVFCIIMIIIKLKLDIHILENKNIALYKLVNILSHENHAIEGTCGLYDILDISSPINTELLDEIKMPQPIIIDNMNEIRIESANMYLPIVDIQSNKNITIHVPRDRRIYTE